MRHPAYAACNNWLIRCLLYRIVVRYDNRIGVRHDNYRQPGLEEDAVLIFVHEAVHPNCGRASFIVPKAVNGAAKDRLLSREKPPFAKQLVTH